MTSIIWDGKTLAADRQITAGSIITGYSKKIDTWSKGYFAVAGAVKYVEPFRLWLEKKTRFQPAKNKFLALYSIGKKVYYCDDDFQPYEAFVPYAIGDASDVAEALVKAGFTAREAVKELSKYCITVGGKIDVVRVA